MTPLQWFFFAVSWISWIVLAALYFPVSVALNFSIPIVISFLTVAVDELADKGGEFRAEVAAVKFAGSVQWAMMVFYFAIGESTIVRASPGSHAQALIFGLISILMAVTSTIAIRKGLRAKWIVVALTIVALAMAFCFGRLLKPEP